MTNVTEPAAPTAPAEPTLTDTKAALSEIWCDLLKRPEVHTNDSFFELGGNSLTAIKLLQRVEKRFGPNTLTPETLFADPRLGSVTEAIHTAATRD